jgi:Sigma-70, region 4
VRLAPADARRQRAARAGRHRRADRRYARPAGAGRAASRAARALAAQATALAPVRHAAVVALYDPGTRNLAELGRQLGMSRERVRVLRERTGRLDTGGNARRMRSRPG